MSDLLRSLGFTPFASESVGQTNLNDLPAGEELASLADGLESWSMPILEKVAAFTPVLLAPFTHWLASTEKQQEEPLAARHPTSNTAFNSFPPYKSEVSLREQIAALLPQSLPDETQLKPWTSVIRLTADPAKMSWAQKHEHVIQLLPYYVSPVYQKQLKLIAQPETLSKMAVVSVAQALGPGKLFALARMGMTAHQLTELASQYRDYVQAVERANTELELYDAARNLAQLLARTHLLAILSMAQAKVQTVIKPIGIQAQGRSNIVDFVRPPRLKRAANNVVSFSTKLPLANNDPGGGDPIGFKLVNPSGGGSAQSGTALLTREAAVSNQVQQSASNLNTSTPATLGTAPTAMATPATLLAGLNLKIPSFLESSPLPASVATALGLRSPEPSSLPTGPDANPKQKALQTSPLKMPSMDEPGLNKKVIEPPSLEKWLRELKTAADEVRRAIWDRYEQERRQSLRPLSPEEQRAQTGERLSPLAQMILDVLEGPQKLVELPMGSIAYEMDKRRREQVIQDGFNWLRAHGIDMQAQDPPTALDLAKVVKNVQAHQTPLNWADIAAALSTVHVPQGKDKVKNYWYDLVQMQLLILYMEDIRRGNEWLLNNGVALIEENRLKIEVLIEKIVRILKHEGAQTTPINSTDVAAALSAAGLLGAVQQRLLLEDLQAYQQDPRLKQALSDIYKITTPLGLMDFSVHLLARFPVIYRTKEVQKALRLASERLSTFRRYGVKQWVQPALQDPTLAARHSWHLPALEFPTDFPQGFKPDPDRVYVVTSDKALKALFEYITGLSGVGQSVYTRDSTHEIRFKPNDLEQLDWFLTGVDGKEHKQETPLNLSEFRKKIAESVQPGMPKLGVFRFGEPIPRAWQPALQAIDPNEVHQALVRDPAIEALMKSVPTSRLLQEQLWRLWTGWRNPSNADAPRAMEEIDESDILDYRNWVAKIFGYFQNSPTWSVSSGLKTNAVDGSEGNLIFHKKGASPVGKFQIEADLKGLDDPLALMALLLNTADLLPHLVKLSAANQPQQPDKRKLTIEVTDHQGLVAVLAALKKLIPTLGETPSLVSGLLHAQEVAPGLRFAQTVDIAPMVLTAMGITPNAGIEARSQMIEILLQRELVRTQLFRGDFRSFVAKAMRLLSDHNINTEFPHLNLFEAPGKPRKLLKDPETGLLEDPV